MSLLQKCLKNLPILITNYIPFEKCTISNPQFLFINLFGYLHHETLPSMWIVLMCKAGAMFVFKVFLLSGYLNKKNIRFFI